jgi:hypothetical protein
MNKKVRVTIKAAAFSVNHNDGLHVELYAMGSMLPMQP